MADVDARARHIGRVGGFGEEEAGHRHHCRCVVHVYTRYVSARATAEEVQVRNTSHPLSPSKPLRHVSTRTSCVSRARARAAFEGLSREEEEEDEEERRGGKRRDSEELSEAAGEERCPWTARFNKDAAGPSGCYRVPCRSRRVGDSGGSGKGGGRGGRLSEGRFARRGAKRQLQPLLARYGLDRCGTSQLYLRHVFPSFPFPLLYFAIPSHVPARPSSFLLSFFLSFFLRLSSSS